MENERLLTNKECKEAKDPYKDWESIATCDGCQRTLLYHQDAKSITALIAWAESNCDDIGHHCGRVKRQCYDCWQELKESVK
jgi:hypothetical protein